jgi:hypothetical protein
VVAKKKPEERTGAGSGALNDPRFITVSKGKSRRDDIPRPAASPSWHPTVRSWYNSLALSGQSEFYEASDWATAVVAAQVYDMFLRTRHANLLPSFLRLTERLGVTVIDRKRNRIELSDADTTDQDEEAADEAVIAWHGRLGIVKDVGGELWLDSTRLRSGDSTAAGCWAARLGRFSGAYGVKDGVLRMPKPCEALPRIWLGNKNGAFLRRKYSGRRCMWHGPRAFRKMRLVTLCRRTESREIVRVGGVCLRVKGRRGMKTGQLSGRRGKTG